MTANETLRVVLLGFTMTDAVEDDIAQRSAVLSTQTHRFAWNLVRSLRSAGVHVALLSAMPVPNYPEYPDVRIRESRFEQEGVQGISMRFINLLALKHVSRFISCCTSGVRFIRRDRTDLVLVHGVHSPFLAFALLMRAGFGLACCVVMTDPPGQIRPGEGRIVRFLKLLDHSLVRTLAGRFDGAIALTRPLADDFARGVSSVIMEGFADPSASSLSSKPWVPARSAGFSVAYAGGLSAEYGVEDLVRAFRHVAGPDWSLHLFGKGPLQEWLQQESMADERIVCHGFVSHRELLPQLVRMSLLINPRPLDQGFVRYSFPSKLLEYMAMGVPVISTSLPGIPEEYFEYIYGVSNTGQELEQTMRWASMNRGEIRSKATRAAAFVLDWKSPQARGIELGDFLRDVFEERTGHRGR